MTDVLLLDRNDGVAIVTLNRPDALNSLTVQLKEELVAAIDELARDDSVRAVLLTGAGRAFSAGQDLREHAAMLQTGDTTPLRTVAEHYNPITHGLITMPKPVIAAVNGMAAGAGASMTFACDFRIVSQNASFLLAFANVGLALDSGASWTLTRLIGYSRATALAMLAEPVSAEAALEMGLVNAVVEPERLMPAAQELATRLASGPTSAYAGIKEQLGFAASASLTEALDKEAEVQNRLGATEDHQAAVAAFLSKQNPTFKGH